MPDSFDLTHNELGQFVLKRPGQDDVNDVRLRRAFPWSAVDKFVSVRSHDGKEILLIDDLSTLDVALRGKIEQQLAVQSFIPKITKINDVDARFGYQQWDVMTDRGPAAFRVQEREDVRFLHDGRFTVKDADGNMYELTSLEKLDAQSRKAVEALL